MTVFLSLAATGLGIWLIAQAHSFNAACNASPLSGAGAGLSVNCINKVSFLFLGFAVVVAGLFTLLLVILMMVKRNRSEHNYRENSKVAHLRNGEGNGLRDAA